MPIGSEFQVNTYTTSSQQFPSVALNANGDFIVVWMSIGSYGTDTDSDSIQGQRYDAVGNTVGGEFQVNTYTTSFQRFPSVALNANGHFIVVWDSIGSRGTDTSHNSIQGQRFDALGDPVGGEFQINTYTTSYQRFPSIALGADGSFIVVWHSFGSSGTDSSQRSVQGQRFDASGETVGGEFQVNTYTTNYQISPSIALNEDGDFIVTWRSTGSYGTDTDSLSIQGQRFDASGETVGGEFQVNTYTTGFQWYPSIGLNAGGDFIVVWSSHDLRGPEPDYSSIQGQRFDASGETVGGEFQVNTYTNRLLGRPSVAVDPNGGFVVVWHSYGSSGTDTDRFSIQSQRFNSAGIPVGGEFQVNTYTTSSQSHPSVGVDLHGGFVVVWDSFGSSGTDTSGISVQGQRFAIPIFADGFESGDTAAWSSTQ